MGGAVVHKVTWPGPHRSARRLTASLSAASAAASWSKRLRGSEEAWPSEAMCTAVYTHKHQRQKSQEPLHVISCHFLSQTDLLLVQ